MVDKMFVSKTLSIKDCGHDEKWLQDQIYMSTDILGLGDLQVLEKERSQSSGGRIDFLMQNPDNETFYEVEVQLGATDETHIIRTLEYYDLERRRYPQNDHKAVIVAEKINRRFFNVISLLSFHIPIIAIQLNMIEVNGIQCLHAVRILDLYQDREVEKHSEPAKEDDWKKKYPWVNEIAHYFFALIGNRLEDANISFTKSYIAIQVNGYNHYAFYIRSGKKSAMEFWANDKSGEKIKVALDEKSIPFILKDEYFRVTLDTKMIEDSKDMFLMIDEEIRKGWDE